MKGKFALIWLSLTGIAGAILFQTSYEVQGREEKLASINRKVIAEQESIQVLKAEWGYLNNMTRLEAMASAHLTLRPAEARQFIASIDVIPQRSAKAPPLPPMASLAPAPAQPAGAYTPAAFKPTRLPATPASAPATQGAAQGGLTQAGKVTAPARAAQVQPIKPQPPRASPRMVATATGVKAPATPKADVLGVMIARLGGNR